MRFYFLQKKKKAKLSISPTPRELVASNSYYSPVSNKCGNKNRHCGNSLSNWFGKFWADPFTRCCCFALRKWPNFLGELRIASTHLSGANQLGQVDGGNLEQVAPDGRQFAPDHLDVGVPAVGDDEPAEDDHGRAQEAAHDVPQDPGTE